MKNKKTDPDLRDWTYNEERVALLNSINLELSVEVSESNLTLDEIIDIVQSQYPHYHFDRTEMTVVLWPCFFISPERRDQDG